MTVKELQAQLKTMPEDAKIVVFAGYGCGAYGAFADKALLDTQFRGEEFVVIIDGEETF